MLNGDVRFERETLARWSWLRTCERETVLRAGDGGALVWIKRGHLDGCT